MKIEALLANPGEWLSSARRSSSDRHQQPGSASLATLRECLFPAGAKKSERIRILEEIKPEVEVLPEMSNSFSQQLNELSAYRKNKYWWSDI